MSRQVKITAVAAAVLVVLTSACSGGSSSASTASSASSASSAIAAATAAATTAAAPSQVRADGDVKDPCTLVTASEAGGALGGTVAPSTSSFTGVYQSCSYTTAAGGTLIVTSRLIDQTGFERSVKESSAPAAPLPGVCGDAFAAGAIVLAWKNGTEVDTRLSGATGDLAAAAKSLAVSACSRI